MKEKISFSCWTVLFLLVINDHWIGWFCFPGCSGCFQLGKNYVCEACFWYLWCLCWEMGWEQYPPHTRLPFSWFSNRQKSPIKIARYKRIKIAAYKEYWFLIFFNFSILQEAVFDKNKGTVCLKTFNLYKKMLTFSKGGSEQGEEAVSVIATVIGRQKKNTKSLLLFCFVFPQELCTQVRHTCFQVYFVHKQQK